jgi:hypothetical protein
MSELGDESYVSDLLNRKIKFIKSLLDNTYEAGISTSIQYRLINLIHEESLIRLTEKQLERLILCSLKDKHMFDTNTNRVEQIFLNIFSNNLIGTNWPENMASLSDIETCEFIWLIQSQAKKAGLSVVDHAGEEVDTSEESLRVSLKELTPL